MLSHGGQVGRRRSSDGRRRVDERGGGVVLKVINEFGNLGLVRGVVAEGGGRVWSTTCRRTGDGWSSWSMACRRRASDDKGMCGRKQN